MSDQTPEPTTEHVMMMSEDEVIYQEEVAILEKRGRRLRRAALTAGIMQTIAIICTIYTTIAIKWVLIEWQQPEKTTYEIGDNLPAYKFGIFCDTLASISNTFVGVLIGLILIGAGVNPASSSMIIVFRIMAQAILATSVIFMVAAAVFVDENLAIYQTIQNYFYSEGMAAIGNQIFLVMLLINRYAGIVANLFTGVHLGLLGFTIVMWGVFPRWMGYTIMVAGPCLIIDSALYMLHSGYDGGASLFLSLPAFIAEFWLAGWMLVNTPHPAKNRDLYVTGLLRNVHAEEAPETEAEEPQK